ncbi:MAG: cell envelope integrity protein TolA [Rhodospirillaceae bacterium]|nr:cell envelope integrity protein TolA [Rhodospirillaceae bacterium]
MKIFRFAALLVALLISLPPAMAEELTSTGPMTRDDSAAIKYDDEAINEQVVRNWNVDPYVFQQCGKVLELRIALDPDGTVTKVDMPTGDEFSDACRQSAESARRAVLIASPLIFPSGNYPSAIRLRFNPDEMDW